MTSFLSEGDEEARIVPKSATPLPVPSAEVLRQRRGFFRTIGVWFGLLRDYTAEDINRLKEAAVSHVEAQVANKMAEAELKVAEAAKQHAEAEEVLARRYATRIKAEGDYAKNMAEAFEKLTLAISRIKEAGGSISFDQEQLMRLLTRGGQEFPEDEHILKVGDE